MARARIHPLWPRHCEAHRYFDGVIQFAQQPRLKLDLLLGAGDRLKRGAR